VSVLTLKYRIKDSTSSKHLSKMAGAIHCVWNYCNAVSLLAFRREKTFLSAYDLHKLTAGTSKDWRLSADTIQQVCTAYVTRRKQLKKVKRKWCSKKRALGWIPFKAVQLKTHGKSLRLSGKSIRVFVRHLLEGKDWKSGCFAQDSVGDWWLCVPVPHETTESIAAKEAVGLDLGLKDTAATSDDEKLEAGRFYRHIQKRIAQAQRRGHKRQAKRLHRRAARRRKDALHRFSRKIVDSRTVSSPAT